MSNLGDTSLLSKAKNSRRPKKMQSMSEDKIVLTVAWLKDEITMSQVADALGCKDVSAYVTLARGAKHYFKTLPEVECKNCKGAKAGSKYKV